MNAAAALGPCRRDDCPGDGPHLHWSSLKYMTESPLHFAHNLRNPFIETKSIRIGRAVHESLLQPDRFGRDWVCYSGQRRGNAWKEFAANYFEKQIMTEVEWVQVERAVAAIRNRACHWLTDDGETEMSLEWKERRQGLACAGRVDRYVDGMLIEVKSTNVWGERQFATQAARMNYHLQAAWYIDGLRAAGYDAIEGAVIVAVEAAPPFDVAVYRLPPEAIAAGRTQVGRLIDELAICIQEDHWPGVAPRETVLNLPAWCGLEPASEIDFDGEVWRP